MSGGGGAGEVTPAGALEWKFAQVFGERAADEEVQDVDIISAVEFDKTGNHLATGDRGGRVVLFEREDTGVQAGHRRDKEKMDASINRHPEFRYKTEFQSHEPEVPISLFHTLFFLIPYVFMFIWLPPLRLCGFISISLMRIQPPSVLCWKFDYLRSLEIEEKINKIRWCQSANGAVFLLSANDKTIKFWKVQDKKVKKIREMVTDSAKISGNCPCMPFSCSGAPTCSMTSTGNGGSLDGACSCSSDDSSLRHAGMPSMQLPLTSQESSPVARCRRIYAHAHDYHINSISTNSDGETFISADDLRINLWNMEISSQSFNIVDVKPTNMEDLTEVITSAEFHPTHCNVLAYSSSKGSIRLIDMRQSALCDRHSKLFHGQDTSGAKSFFTEIIASISDIKFGNDGRHILSRDYMNLKLWDINMDSGPVATFQVHEHLRPKLVDLYESDSIFDKFECCIGGDGLRVATGSYGNLFRVFGCSEGSTEATTLEASRNPMRGQNQTPSKPGRSSTALSRTFRRGSENSGVDSNKNALDLMSKLLHLAWHPTENSLSMCCFK